MLFVMKVLVTLGVSAGSFTASFSHSSYLLPSDGPLRRLQRLYIPGVQKVLEAFYLKFKPITPLLCANVFSGSDSEGVPSPIKAIISSFFFHVAWLVYKDGNGHHS